MNKKGQALVEFIIIMPIMLMILLAIFDYGRIINAKLDLEHAMDEATLKDNYNEYNYNCNTSEDKKVCKMSKNIELSCPILVSILSKEYKVEIERVAYE